MDLDNMTVAVLVIAVLVLVWYMMQQKKKSSSESEGFLKCGAPVGERTLLAMNLGAEGAPAC